MEFIIENSSELPSKVADFLPVLKKCRVFLIHGQMGVGKTTFIQELLRQMGVDQPGGSPTYSLINSYETVSYGTVYHLDLYRLKKLEEVYDIGLEELLDDQVFLFIEWPDLVQSMVNGPHAEMTIALMENNTRKISLTFYE